MILCKCHDACLCHVTCTSIRDAEMNMCDSHFLFRILISVSHELFFVVLFYCLAVRVWKWYMCFFYSLASVFGEPLAINLVMGIKLNYVTVHY